MLSPSHMTIEEIDQELSDIEAEGGRYSARWWNLWEEQQYRYEEEHPLPDPRGYGVDQD